LSGFSASSDPDIGNFFSCLSRSVATSIADI
jgi:hypothetical protein